MTANKIREMLESGELSLDKDIYGDTEGAKKRFIKALDSFITHYGGDREVSVFSVPGRSEISGNHTDHNCGCVLAGSVNRDVIAIAGKNGKNEVNIYSDGYPEEKILLSETGKRDNFKKYTSGALIAGVLAGFEKAGLKTGGFDAYFTSDVPSGSGLSSSAAYEVTVGTVLNYLYCGGEIEACEIAKIARFAESEYFGKPCGLMDQMACAVGGFVYIDFENPENPVVLPIDFDLSKHGYELCIVSTGSSHADLNEDYDSIPEEMKSVARLLGRDVLRGLTETDIVKNLSNLRRVAGDRALLRAFHFIRENERVEKIKSALENGNISGFLSGVNESGKSSFEYLQNVYSTANVKEQGLSIALALSEGYLAGREAAVRVHGGGFAGTIQVFLKRENASGFAKYMDSVFGDGSAKILSIRKQGATKLF